VRPVVIAALAAALLAPACAWDAGEPFGEVAGELTARWTAPADRDAGDGWQRLASDFQVQVVRAAWTTTSLDLVPGINAALDFDPAHPPAGYTLCHGGHCHATDGRLVPYEDVAAELAGDAPPAPVATFATGDLDLIAGATVALACDGGCELPRGTVSRIQLGVTAIELAGRVRDGRSPARFDGERAWTLVLAPAAEVPLVGRADLPIDRASPPDVDLTARLAPTVALLDGVRWEVLAATPGDLMVDSDSESTAAITTELGETALDLTISRSD
jgi:hypothetical protein